MHKPFFLPAGCAETAALFEDADFEGARPRVGAMWGPDVEVLSAMLRAAHSRPDTLAKALRTRFRCLTDLFGATEAQLFQVPGMTEAAARTILACQELHVRRAREAIGKRTVISSWTALLAYAKVAMAGAAREEFRVLFLDKKNALIADEVLAHGTVDHAPVYPREVMRRALELDASAIILAHNHPSGDPTPSTADVEMTRQVQEAGRPLRVTVHDHIVVGREGVASLKALGLF